MKYPMSCFLIMLATLCVILSSPFVATAQQQEAPVYTFVVLWDVPRTQWADFTAYRDKNSRPVVERMFKDGTLVSWGYYETVVHIENGYTHGGWYSATSIAGIERIRTELVKLPPNPAAAGARHRDRLFRSLIYRTKGAGPTTGYLYVSATQVQPGKGEEWRELWDKYSKPTLEELLANGTITRFALQVEDVHTENPGWRYSIEIAPSAEGIDKAHAAFMALGQKGSAEERRAIGAAFREVTVPGAHWDFFARITNYAQK